MQLKFFKVILVFLVISALILSTVSKTVYYRSFIQEYYLAGKCFSENKIPTLYDNFSQQTSFEGDFYKYQHNYFKDLPSKFNLPFFYMPLVALIFSPFAYTNFRLALVLWMIINVVAIFVCLKIISLLHIKDSKQTFHRINYSFYTFLYLPILYNIFQGQSTIILGILPLLAGYYFWSTNKNTISAFCWSLLILKPQYIFVPMFLLVLEIILGKNKIQNAKILFTSIIIAVLISLSNIVFFGFNNFKLWLNLIKYATQFDLLVSIKHISYVFSSLYFCICSETLKFGINQTLANILFLAIAICTAVAIILTFKKIDFENTSTKALSLTIASLTFFIVSLHSLYYDYSLLIFSYFILCEEAKIQGAYNQLLLVIKNHFKLILILISIYGLIIFYGLIGNNITQKTSPIILIIPFAVIYYVILYKISKYKVSNLSN